MVKLKAVGIHKRKGSSGFEASETKFWYEEAPIMVKREKIDMIVQHETEVLSDVTKDYIKKTGNLLFKICLDSTATVTVVAKSIDDLYNQIYNSLI